MTGADPLIAQIKKTLEPLEFGDQSFAPTRKGQRQASVLMPLVNRDGVWRVIFTQRPKTMPSHAGQISFPGGGTAPHETPSQGALREVHEEIGVGAQDIQLLGRLPSFNAVSDYRVTPFVGVVSAHADIIPDPEEVDEVFELPFLFFMDPRNHVENVRTYDGQEITIYDMPWPDTENCRYNVWGMTAMMLYRVYQRGFHEAG